jgi:hypothetical protein
MSNEIPRTDRGVDSRLSKVISGLAEIFATNQFYPSVQEDLAREPGEPTLAQKMGGDVFVVRVGADQLSKEKITLAAQAIRKANTK